MQSAQESLAELRAAIRYCENAVSAAESTIESIDFRLQMKSDDPNVTLEGYKNVQMKQRQQIKDLEVTNEALVIDNHNLERKVEDLTKQAEELTQANMNVVCDNDDLKDEVSKLREDKERLTALEVQLRDKIRELKDDKATMPVIPRDVAIAIFREGIKQGVDDVCNELRGQTIVISENEYVGDFEVSFSRDIDLDDELDLDWVRDKVGSYETKLVESNLKGLLKSLNFECRIHGIDDND